MATKIIDKRKKLAANEIVEGAVIGGEPIKVSAPATTELTESDKKEIRYRKNKTIT